MAKTFVSNNYVEKPDPRSTEGGTIKFFALSVSEASSLRNVAKPLFRGLATLFSGVGHEGAIKQTQKKLVGPNGEMIEESTNEQDAIQPLLAEAKLRARDMAINEMVDAFSDEKNQVVIMRVIMDSLREEGFPRPITDAAARDLAKNMDVAVLTSLLEGVYEANKGVLTPLAQRFLKASLPEEPKAANE